jgi:leucyl-tRNA synthetase
VLLTLLAPVCPFITDELWRRLGLEGSVHDGPWPVADTSLLIEDEVQMVVQINGKVRGRITITSDAAQDAVEAAARADEVIAGHLDGEVLKVIVVPNKLVNFVVRR